MCSILVVVREVARENPSQVGIVENDDMFEALSANGTDDSLYVRRLPWRTVCNHDFLDTHVLDPLAKEIAVDRVSVANEESWDVVARKRFDDLLRCPLGRRMLSRIEVDNHAAVMAEYDETEQDAKRRSWYREEVDGDDVGQMIVQESPPRLRRRLAVADSVLVHSGLRRLEAKESKFRADSRRAP